MVEQSLARPNQEQPGTDLVPGFGSARAFELAQRQAQLLARSTLVPKEYQNNIPNCVIALNMAARMGADPLMVMQNLYIVHSKPGWSAQFLIATFNASGRFGPLRFEWIGKPESDEWGCRAWATEVGQKEPLRGAWVTIALAKKEGWYAKNGSKWQTMPEQMLMYRAAAWFIRAYAPGLAMGMHTAEELVDIAPREEDVPTDIGPAIDVDPETGEVLVEAEESEPQKATQPTLADGPGF